VRGVILAWAGGMGIIIWRAAVKEHRPPVPGQMLAATGLFVALAALAEYQPAASAATLFAFGVDAAILMQVLPGTTTNSKNPAVQSKVTAPAPAKVTTA
jgi:hypothetical protein